MKKTIVCLLGIALAGFVGFLTWANLPNAERDRQLAADQQNLKDTEAGEEAKLDRKLQDSVIQNMLLRGAMTDHESVVFEECREEQSLTPTCKRLAARVSKWQKAHAGDHDKQLQADGVKR